MTAAEMIFDLRSKGINLWVEGNNLRYRAPKGALTADLRSRLAERKTEILAFLGQSATVSPLPSSIMRATSRNDDLPLSSAEEGAWLLEQLSPGVTAWNMRSALRISGELNVAVLERSFNALIERQEILRTTFRLIEGKLVRLISPTLNINLPVSRLDPLVDKDSAIRRITTEEQRRPFDLATAPLMRVRLLQVNEREHVLVVAIHHIICDGWSQQIFFRELFSLYEAFLTDQPPNLPDLPIQYSDYAIWMHESERAKFESHLSYWKNKLNGAAIAEIPSDKQRPAQRSFRGARQEIKLSSDLARRLKDIGNQERATLFMILVAAFQVLLCRYTGATDIAVGLTIAGRSRPEVQNLIGFFINLLVLRSDLSGSPCFRDLLRRVREDCLEAYERQNVPFEKLVEAMNPGHGLHRNPFFQVLFNVFNMPPVPRDANGLLIEGIFPHTETAKFDLTIHALETEDTVTIQVVYSVDLFSDARIAQMLEQYKYLLEQVGENTDDGINLYSLVTPSAKKLLPDPTVPLDNTWHGAVHEIFASYAQSQPNKLAVEDPHEGWSYKELNDRSNRLAQYLLAEGIRRGDIVAVYGHRSAALVWALLAVLKAGAAFCVVDPEHPAERVKQYLDAADPKGFIQTARAGEANAEIEEVLSSFSPRCRIALPDAAIAQASQFLSRYSKDDPAVKISPNDLAYVIFTSGSTGKPKGVMGRHGPLTHFLPWLKETFGLSESDRFSFLSALATNKLQRELFTALTLGGTLCIPDSDDIGAFGKLDEWLRDKAVSVVHLTPAMAQLLEETATHPIPSVRRAFFGGDLLGIRDVDGVRRLMPHAEITNFYNSSETQRGGGYIVFSNQTLDHAKEIPPLGRGVKDVQLLVLNPVGKMAGVGELGEICVRSPHMAAGYLRDEKLTKERFITNPFTGIDGDRIYRTGEQGRYLPNGDVEFVARRENQVSVRSFRVELGEIESVLNAHPAVSEAVVLAQENPRDHLVAYVLANRQLSPSINELRNYVKAKLPNYMVPASFLLLDSLPLTPTGKVDRRSLPMPERTRVELERTFVAPRNRLESQLAKIWAEVLGVKAVGVRDNFFEMGGHSLLAVRLFAQIEKTLGKRLSLATLFQAPTVEQLASILRQQGWSASWSSLVAIQPYGSKPPFFWVHGENSSALLPRYLGPDQPLYGLVHQSQDGKRALYTSIEDIAAHYLQEMRTVQPQGPYFLGGYCIGGTIAFEMAQQLQRMGQKVALLVLLDASNPGVLSVSPNSPKPQLQVKRGIQGMVERINKIAKRGAYKVCLSIGYPLPPTLLYLYREDVYHKARQKYVAQPYAGRVTVFKTEGLSRDPRLVWGRLAGGGLEVVEVPGKHADIVFREQQIQALAKQLKACLDQAQAKGTVARSATSVES